MNQMKIIKMVFISLMGILILTGCSTGSDQANHSESIEAAANVERAGKPETVANASEAKARLVEGNQRYLQGMSMQNSGESVRLELSKNGQAPFAIIVGCSDSRVPPEVIFDQGLGELFVVRNAGNVVDPVVLGTLEYGAEHLEVPLIVVLGHEKCGAVKATVDGVRSGEKVSGDLGEIIGLITPSYGKVIENSELAQEKQPADLYELCADQNIQAAIEKIKSNSVIGHLLESGKVSVIGAKYHMDTGEVSFIQD